MKKTVSFNSALYCFAVARCFASIHGGLGDSGLIFGDEHLLRSNPFPSSKELAKQLEGDMYGRDHFDGLSEETKKAISAACDAEPPSDYVPKPAPDSPAEYPIQVGKSASATGTVPLKVPIPEAKPETHAFSPSSAHLEEGASQVAAQNVEDKVCICIELQPASGSAVPDLSDNAGIGAEGIPDEGAALPPVDENAPSMQIPSDVPALALEEPPLSAETPSQTPLEVVGINLATAATIQKAIPQDTLLPLTSPNPSSVNNFMNLVSFQSPANGSDSLGMQVHQVSGIAANTSSGIAGLFEYLVDVFWQTQEAISKAWSCAVDAIVYYVNCAATSVGESISHVQTSVGENAFLRAIGLKLFIDFLVIVGSLIGECLAFIFRCVSLVLHAFKEIILGLVLLLWSNILVALLVAVVCAIAAISMASFLGYNLKLMSSLKNRVKKIIKNDTRKRYIYESARASTGSVNVNLKNGYVLDALDDGAYKAGVASPHIIDIRPQPGPVQPVHEVNNAQIIAQSDEVEHEKVAEASSNKELDDQTLMPSNEVADQVVSKETLHAYEEKALDGLSSAFADASVSVGVAGA